MRKYFKEINNYFLSTSKEMLESFYERCSKYSTPFCFEQKNNDNLVDVEGNCTDKKA